MKLNISDLQKEPGARNNFAFVLADLPEGSTIKFAKPALVQGEVINTGHGLELKAQVQTTIVSKCDRCLDEVDIPLEFDICEMYVQEDQLAADNGDEESSLVLTYRDDWLDLAEAVQENLVLQLPMRTVCEPECPGLCPSCGKNLKTGSCLCSNEDVDPRMAILTKLKTRN